MADDNHGARHSAAARRRAAKERQKARTQSQAAERRLAKDAEREGRRLEKERKRRKGEAPAEPDVESGETVVERAEEAAAIERLLVAEDAVTAGVERAEVLEEAESAEAVVAPPGLAGAYHAAVAGETVKAGEAASEDTQTLTVDAMAASEAPESSAAPKQADAAATAEMAVAPEVAEQTSRPRRADRHKRPDKVKDSGESTAAETAPKPAKTPKAKAPPQRSGWTATFAAIGIVILILIIAAVAYQVFVVNRPVSSGKSTTPAPVVTSPPGQSSSSGADKLTTIASLGSLGPAFAAPLYPLPGNPELTERLLVVAGGDVMMDRRVSELIDSEGGTAPLDKVATILKRGDFAIVNLETPLSTNGEAQEKDVTFRGNPNGVESLVAAGVDAVTLANNHALDYGDVALKDTLDLLDKNKIAHTGAGMNSKQAWKPATVTVKGKRVAYLGWSYIEPAGFVAGSDSAGIAGAKADSGEIAAAIKAAKRQADFVIVSFHWGVEYTDYPIDEQKELGRLAIDSGADLVASHHPHVIQGIEVYKDKLIAYSLGDFVFDHYSRKTGEAFILEVTMNRSKTLTARAIPVYLSDMGQPEVVTGEEADAILGRLKEISSGFGTKMQISNNIATLKLGK